MIASFLLSPSAHEILCLSNYFVIHVVYPKQLRTSCPLDSQQTHPSMLNSSSGKPAASGKILQIESSNFSLVSSQDVSCGSLGSKISSGVEALVFQLLFLQKL